MRGFVDRSEYQLVPGSVHMYTVQHNGWLVVTSKVDLCFHVSYIRPPPQDPQGDGPSSRDGGCELQGHVCGVWLNSSPQAYLRRWSPPAPLGEEVLWGLDRHKQGEEVSDHQAAGETVPNKAMSSPDRVTHV